MNQVGKNIKKLRELKGLTQDSLAEKLNVTRQSVSNWETGKNQPDIETLESLSAALDADVTEIIYGKKDSYPMYQRRYICRAAVSLVLLLSALLFRATVLPVLYQIAGRTYRYHLETAILNFISLSIMSWLFAYAILSVLSFRFELYVGGRKAAGLIGAVLLVPAFSLILEYLGYIALHRSEGMYFFTFLIMHQTMRALVSLILPFISGLLIFLGTNRKNTQ